MYNHNNHRIRIYQNFTAKQYQRIICHFLPNFREGSCLKIYKWIYGFNPRQSISGKVKKLSKVWQDQKTLTYAFVQSLTAVPNIHLRRGDWVVGCVPA